MINLRVFTDDEIRVFTKNYAEEREIGQAGAYGQVYKGKIRSNMRPHYPDCPKKLAIKVSKLRDQYRKTQWENEIAALGSISHKNVIRLVGYSENALVYERAKRDLQGYQPADQRELDNILVGLASELEAVHSAGFIHWDLQQRNILLMKDGTVKIADFGLSTKKGSPMTFFNHHRLGVFNPDDTEAAQEKFDVYCFGFIMRSLANISRSRYSPTTTPRRDLSDECCSAKTPDERPSMDIVVSKLKAIQLEALRQEEADKSKKRRLSSMEPSPRKKSK